MNILVRVFIILVVANNARKRHIERAFEDVEWHEDGPYRFDIYPRRILAFGFREFSKGIYGRLTLDFEW